MNTFKNMHLALNEILSDLAKDKGWTLDASKITVEQPKDLSHGDMATNCAMILCQQAGLPPRKLAETISEKLLELDCVEKADIAGPGFINLKLKNDVWFDVLQSILDKGVEFGHSDMGGGQKVNIEYVSANPTGPMHIGHARGAVYGDVTARLLQKVGYDVTKEYYINDAGSQVDVLGRSAYLRYLEANGQTIDIPEGLYPGEYLIQVGQGLKEKYGDTLIGKDESIWLDDIKTYTIDAMMDMIRQDLKDLGVEHDVFSSEKEKISGGAIDDAIAVLEQDGLVYEGVLEPPMGKIPDDWEERPQTLFKSTEFGDDIDRPLRKSDGSQTYFASDIAYHRDKYNRGFTKQINIWGADHGGYVKRMCGAVTAITKGKATLKVKLCQLVKLIEDGEVVKMSKRSGNFITLRELVEEVGRDVVRFYMMTRKADAPLDFDLKLVKEQSRENPVFYVHYAHARCCSVLRQAKEQGFDYTKGDISLLEQDAFMEVIKELSLYPRVLESSALNEEPHRVAFYLSSVASKFHELWAKGSGIEKLRFIRSENADETNANLALVYAVKTVLASGLNIFAVEAKEEL